MPKLSPRLRFLSELLVDGEDVWDLCCDHGYLGESALASGRFPRVNFVDRVPGIVSKLEKRLGRRPGAKYWTVDAAAIDAELTGTVVVAGVGGDVAVRIVEGLAAKGRLKSRRVIVSPHSQEVWAIGEIARALGGDYVVESRKVAPEGRWSRPVWVWNFLGN